MAIELFQGVVDRIHTSLESSTPLLSAKSDWSDFKPYYSYGDFTDFLYSPENYDESFNNLFVAALLILAAEEELDGYPMEAVSE